MAIIKDVEYKGLSAPAAYITVAIPSIPLSKEAIDFGVWYRSAQGGEVFHAETHTAPYLIDGENPFIQAYEYLKTLPAFHGCIDG